MYWSPAPIYWSPLIFLTVREIIQLTQVVGRRSEGVSNNHRRQIISRVCGEQSLSQGVEVVQVVEGIVVTHHIMILSVTDATY